MTMVRVVFSRQANFASLVLRTFTWSSWSHVAIVDGDNVIEASALHGVRERPLQELINEASQYEFLDIPSKNPEAVIAAARTQLGKPYDWFGVFGIAFRRKWQDDDCWFCSEFVAWSFEAAREPLFTAKVWRITPRDINIPAWTRFTT